MKIDRKRTISIVCLLAGLGLVWLGTGGGIWPGDEVQNIESTTTVSMESASGTDDEEDVLADIILQVFSEQGGGAEVQKVSWESEELTEKLWEQMEQWREKYKDKPYTYEGYIELLGDPSGKPEEGFLQEYATVQYKNAQYTYLVTDAGIYEIQSRGDRNTWRACMQELLCSVPNWQITKKEAEQYVHEMRFDWYERYNENPPDIELGLWYQGMEFSFYGETSRLLAYRSGREYEAGQEVVPGRECLWFKQMYYGREIERQICIAEALPVFETYRELREYLQTLYPDMWDCEFYTRKTGEYDPDPLIGLMTRDAEYGYYCREGQWYQVYIREDAEIDTGKEPYYWVDSTLRYRLKYDYRASYQYRVSDRGYVAEADLTQSTFYLEEEISPGQIFSFDCRVTEEEEGELIVDSTYEIAVSVPRAEEPFQILEVHSAEWEPFSFEDFNADGFQDLRILYFYGADGGSAAHYIWSPSREEFIQAPEELSYFGQYGIDQEKRRLSVHYHGSAISGSESLYQWSGEMDCELIRYFSHNDVYDYEEKEYKGTQIDIYSYENGQKKILSDYLYPIDEYMERDEIWGIYYLDFVWEQEVTLEGQEGPCILRYAQENAEFEEDAHADTEGYLDYLFLFREDTYLICALEKQEAPAAYSGFTWEGETGQLTVRYEDGLQRCYQWDGAAFQICVADTLPKYETYREMREYLQALYPELRECEIYTHKEGQYCEEPFIALKLPEAEYGYFCQEGRWKRACYESLNQIRQDLGYDEEAYRWCVTDEGNISELDYEQQSYYFLQEIDQGRFLALDCVKAGTKEGEPWQYDIYQVAVSVPGQKKAFQVFEAETCMAGERIFSFEDFNADGCPDLTVLYYYGANGGSAAHFLWSPSRKVFVKAPEELEKYSSYSINPEKRQLNIHIHDSAEDGTEYFYQWTGETDCELLRYYDHQTVYNDDYSDCIGIHEKVSVFENGREKVLSDYIYPMEECTEEGLYEMYALDFVWEQELTLTAQDCVLRYAQVVLEGGEQMEKRYLDFLYLFREDTYLICRLRGQEAPAAYADIVWEEETGQLAVNYEDGTTYLYQWDGTTFRFPLSRDS